VVFGKVQTGGRGRDRTFSLGIDRLVPGFIVRIVGAFDVRRKRYVAQSAEKRFIDRRSERHHLGAVALFRHDRRLVLLEAVALPHPLTFALRYERIPRPVGIFG